MKLCSLWIISSLINTIINFSSISIYYLNILFLVIIIHLDWHPSDSRLQFKDEDDDHVDELVSAEALPMNQQKEKRRYSGVRMKGHQPVSSSEVASSKTSKPGKASVFVVSSVPEENQDPQQSITKTPRKKQKMQKSKVR